MILYCLKEYKPGEFLTKNKMYIVRDGMIEYDSGWDTEFNYRNTLNGIRVFPELCIKVKEIKKDVEVGDYVVSTKTDEVVNIGEILRVIRINPYGIPTPYVRTRVVTGFGSPEMQPCTLLMKNSYSIIEFPKTEIEII